MMNRLLIGCIGSAGALACSLTGTATAGDLETGLDNGLYQLHNHPDGNAAPPAYGLRLDELVDVSGAHDIFTFDFDHDLSDMRMFVDDNAIHIFGTVFGGLNAGDGYAGDWVGTWWVDFTYAFYEFVPGDDDRWTIGAAPADHWGTINAHFGDEADFWLQDEAGSNPYSFRLGDEDDNAGHRGFDGYSGWGWLNHAPVVHDEVPRNGTQGPPETFPHSYDSDWLFVVGDPIDQDVPEPGTAALLVLSGVALLRRRR